MKNLTVEEMLERLIVEFQENGQWGVLRIYRSTSHVFSEFCAPACPTFRELTPHILKQFEIFLRRRKCAWNTVSTYMRVLRHAYFRAVEDGLADMRPCLFKRVYTGTRADCKKALEPLEIARILHEAGKCLRRDADALTLSPNQRRTLLQFVLMFDLRGLPFVDLACLCKKDLHGNVLSYRRRKTGHPLRVTLTEEVLRIVDILKGGDERSPYLFPILRSAEGTGAAYREYQSALRAFNYNLSVLRRKLGIESALTSYTARHTWATMAYYCEIHPGIISEAMGHSSISITETYLKPFRDERIDEANRTVISFVKGWDVSGRS